MKIKYTLPKAIAILAMIVAFASCEEDLNTIGANIIGDENFNSEFTDSLYIVSYSRKLVPTQTSALPVYQLGVYNDPVYGKSTVNFLTQLTLNTTGANYNRAPRVDSVVLFLPFFNQSTTDDDEVTTYTLDSIYGDTPIDIKIYESNYFLRDFDPDSGFQEVQNYYSNQGQLFESFLGELIHTVEDFKPSNEPFKVNDTISFIPALRVKLPTQFFKNKIIDMGGSVELLNNNNFRDYFRGLYFQVESNTDDGNLFMMDLENASLTIHYTFQTGTSEIAASAGDTIERFEGEVGMSFNAISVNTYKNNLNPAIAQELFNPNTTEGEETLYVRGGDGIITVVELFGPDLDNNGVADQLEDLREKEWIINEANLIFYVDKDKVTGGDTEPERLVLFDINNGTLLADFNMDLTSNLDPVDAINVHLGRLQRGSDGNGDYYKLRLTNHISNLINKDSTNVALGVMVSQNVLVTDFQDLENIQAPGIDRIPAASIVSPEGTVLVGNNSANANRRLKLQIYYTEPE